MSRTQTLDVELAELLFACRYCGAEPCCWCQIVREDVLTNEFAYYLHSDRYHQLYDALRLSGRLALEREQRDRYYALVKRLRDLINTGTDDAAWLLIRLREVLAG